MDAAAAAAAAAATAAAAAAAAGGLRRRVDEPLQVRVDGLAVRPEELEQVGEQRCEVAREECVRVARLALPSRPADAVHVLRQVGAKVPADHVTQPWGGQRVTGRRHGAADLSAASASLR